ncbi:LamG domain-containing protein [Glycomyces halotolerans]
MEYASRSPEFRPFASPTVVRVKRGTALSLSAVLATSILLAEPGQTEEDATAGNDCVALSDTDHAVDSEATALALAEDCGRPVEIDAMREDAARFTAEVDGSITAELFATPQWTTDETGAWVDIDPTLTIDENDLITAVAVPGEVMVSGGGSAQPLTSVTTESGETLDLWWPTELPEPELDGAEARYRGVLDGVDLIVEAGRTGFSYRLEVLTAEAAADPGLAEIAVELGGTLEVEQDQDTRAVTALDPTTGETVLAANQALMWDASEPASPFELPGPTQFLAEQQRSVSGSGERPGDPGRVESMDVSLKGTKLSVVPDAGMLADPDTEFPVVIDPSFETPQWAWTTVGDGQYADSTWWDDAAWPRSGGLRMGYNGWVAPGEEGYGTWRSMIRFDIGKLAHASVSSATMSVDIRHTGGCLSYPLELWQTNVISAGAVPTSWNSTAGNWLHGAPLDTQTVESANSASGCPVAYPTRQVDFSSADLAHHVDRHANAPHMTITLGLKAAVEDHREHWFRADAETARMTVVYQPAMSLPSNLTVDGVSCLAPEGARVAGTQPTLSAVPHSSDGEARVSFWVSDASGASVAEHISADTVPSDEEYAWQIDSPLPDGTYEFRSRANTADGVTARYTTWCTFEVDSTLDAVAEVSSVALTCPYDTTGLDPAVDTLESPTEGGALLLAEACDIGVEVAGLQDFHTRVTADPDGLLTAKVEAVPTWAPDASGEWVEVDTGFAVAADGTITTNAAVSDITVSGGGAGPFVTATSPEGASVSLTWPEALPAPVVTEDTVIYPEVRPGLDLQVQSDLDGFSYALVVKTPEAAADPQLTAIDIGINADGLTVTQDATGAVTAVDSAGETVFAAPAAYMWDSSLNPEPGSETSTESEPSTFSTTEEEPVSDLGEDDPMPGRYAEVGVDLEGTTLTVTPDAELLSDPAAEFPITIDPPFVGKRLAWANIFQNRPGSSWTNDKDWPRKGGMRVGYNSWYGCSPDACGLWRSAVRFGIGGLKNKDVLSARVSMTQTHSGGCGSTDLALWEVNRKMGNGTTWNSITSATLDHLQTKSVASSNSGGCGTNYPDRDVNFTGSAVKSKLNSRLSSDRSWMTFMVRSSNESDPHAWRRIDIKSVELIVTYNSPALNPTSLRTNGKSCVTSGYSSSPWTSEVQPTLSGVPRDPDGKVGAYIQVRQKGSSSNVRTWSTSRNQKSNSRQSWTIPSSKKLPSGEYRWRMRSLDDYKNGTDNWFDSWCYFRVDATAPTPPKVELVSPANPQAGDEVTFRFTSTDAHSGMNAFYYGVNEEAQRHKVSSSGTTTITVTAPSSGGYTWLYVWAADKAGNSSKRMQADFFAPRIVEPVPAAAWRLDGDGLDDAAGIGDADDDEQASYDLTMGRTSGWTDSGPETPVGEAMLFGGTDCVTTQSPVIRTDVPYTVSAWVRSDVTDTGVRTVLSQSGRNGTGFALRYRGMSGEWDMRLIGEDSSDPSVYSRAGSTSTPAQGQWTHLAATVDPGSKVIQLWVDGTLEDTETFAHEAWHADGPVNIGCSGTTDNHRQSHYFKGAVQHVGIWQGLLTDAQVQKVMAGDLPAGIAGEWLLRGDAADSSLHANDLTVPASGSQWVQDQWGREKSAIDLDGSSCVTAGDTQPNRSDGSFSLSAWARVDAVDTGAEHTVAGETFQLGSKFKLYLTDEGKWAFSVVGVNDAGESLWDTARDTSPATAGAWTHLTGVYDVASGDVRLYVDGQLAGTNAADFEPHLGYGKVNIGCRGSGSGNEGGGKFTGTISDVRLWRGALTTERVADVYGGNKAVERKGHWSLDWSSLTDAEGAHDLAQHGDCTWGWDQFPLPFSALEFHGNGWAQSNGPVVRTDESFTIATWVRIDSTDGPYQTILSQGGQNRVGFNLNYKSDADGGRFHFAMPSADSTDSVTWHSMTAEHPIDIGGDDWYHVAVIVDIPGGEMTMYVNGEKAASAEATSTPWNATGDLYLGVYGRQNGDLLQHMNGAVDRVQLWQSTLDPERITDMARSTTGN